MMRSTSLMTATVGFALMAGCTPEPTLSPSEAVARTVAELRDRDPALRADWSAERGRVVLLGSLAAPAAGDASDIARRFLVGRSIPRRESTDYELLVAGEETDANGSRHVTFEQSYRGLPVWGKQIIVHVDSQGAVVGVNGRYLPEGVAIDTRATIAASDAVALAVAARGPGTAEAPPFAQPALVIYDAEGSYRSAWMFTLPGTNADGGPAEWRFFVDALTGRILDRSDRVRTFATNGTGLDCDLVTRQLAAFNDGGTFLLRDVTRATGGGSETHTKVPGGEFSSDGDGNWDQTELPVRDSQQPEVSIHFWLGQSYDRLKALTGRDGWDDQGLAITGFAHFPGANNAFWFPDRQAVAFGESEGSTLRAFGCANDVIAHEFMHGVVEFTAALDDGLEADAMNESFADIFGAMVDAGDWLIGEGLFQAGNSADRHLADPTVLGDPDHYDDLPDEEHAASTITSHAFYLAAEGLTHTTPTGYSCDVSLGRTTAFQHFFHALDHFLTPGSDMPELGDTVSFVAAHDLAQGRRERADVFGEAFRRVGLGAGLQKLTCAEPWVSMTY